MLDFPDSLSDVDVLVVFEGSAMRNLNLNVNKNATTRGHVATVT